MKLLKPLLIGTGGVVVLAGALAAYFAATFDPNRYREDIERIAREKTGRTLKLKGPIELSFFPNLGARVAGVTLSEKGSEQTFVSLDSARASVAVLPLLKGEVVVDRVAVSGLKANVVKDKSGRFNFQDLMEPQQAGKPAAGQPPAKDAGGKGAKLDIAGVTIEQSAVSYRDLGSGQELAISELRLVTGRIGERAEGRLELAAAAKGSKPSLDLRLGLNGDYKIDLPAKAYAFAKVDGSVKGTLEKDAVDVKLTAPKLDVAADRASGEALTLEASIKGPGRNADAKVRIAGIQGSAKALSIPSLAADLALSGPEVPRSLKLSITGKAQADLDKQTAEADLATKFDESNIQAKLGLAKFSPPAYRFDVNVDRLNLDQYLPKPAAKPAAAAAPDSKGGAPAPAQAESPIDLSALKGLDAQGRLQVGALQVKGLKLAQVKAEVKAAGGRLDVSPHSANLYEGSVTGALSAQAEGNRIAIRETLTNIAIGPLLRDFAQQDRLEGRGNLSLDVTGAGPTVNALKKSLAGTAKVQLKDGAVKGFDIAGMLKKAKSLGKSDQGGADSKAKTDFSEMSASFVIKDGVARNQDLDMKAPLLRVGGAGDIDIGNSRLDYVTKASVVATSKGQGGKELDDLAGLTVPVKLSGPFDNLQYQVDYGAVAAGLVKSKVGEKLQERLLGKPAAGGGQEKGGASTGEKLRGLFGR